MIEIAFPIEDPKAELLIVRGEDVERCLKDHKIAKLLNEKKVQQRLLFDPDNETIEADSRKFKDRGSNALYRRLRVLLTET